MSCNFRAMSLQSRLYVVPYELGFISDKMTMAMVGKPYSEPNCSHCGKCCIELGCELTMVREDYIRWKSQRRLDILRYAWIPDLSDGWGDLWIDPETGEDVDVCPYLKQSAHGKYLCEIYDTKPKVCREFWCEGSYGVGEKGVPFKTGRGWLERKSS